MLEAQVRFKLFKAKVLLRFDLCLND